MTSPLSRISAGNFFKGVICEYASLGWPGATVVGTNSMLSIRPSSIAAMRTLRANGEAGEKVSFIFDIPLKNQVAVILRCEPFASLEEWCFVVAHPSRRARTRAPQDDGITRRLTPR